jgi:hypothetical protein
VESATLESAASEPAKPSGHKSNAESRKAELQAEIDSLLKQRADLRREAAPAPTHPATALPASQPAPAGEAREPQLADFEADPATYPDPYAAYLEARADYRADQRVTRALADLEGKQRAQEQDRAVQARATASREKVEAALAAEPTLKDAIAWERFDAVPSSLLKPGEAVNPQNDLAEAVLDSEAPADLMVHLSEQPKDLARLLASASPRMFWRTLGQIEGAMSAPKRATPKTITDAPEPVPAVGTRVSSLSDADAALRANDFSGYAAARDRQRIAGMR